MSQESVLSETRCSGLVGSGISVQSSRRNVYDTCMARIRTNIEVEDDYVQAIMSRYHLRTKTEVVDLALRKLASEPMTREEALAMRGSNSIGDVPTDQPPRGIAA